MKKFFVSYSSILLFVFGIAQKTYAGQPNKLIVPIPDVVSGDATTEITTFQEYVSTAYTFGIILGSFFAVAFIVYAAIQYITSRGDAGKIMDAKDRILSSIYGLLLLIGAVLILTTINPQLVRQELSTIDGGVSRPRDPSWFNRVETRDFLVMRRVYDQIYDAFKSDQFRGDGTFRYATDLLEFYYTGKKTNFGTLEELNIYKNNFGVDGTIASARADVVPPLSDADFAVLVKAEQEIEAILNGLSAEALEKWRLGDLTLSSTFKRQQEKFRNNEISLTDLINQLNNTIVAENNFKQQEEELLNTLGERSPVPDYAYALLTYYHRNESSQAIDIILKSERVSAGSASIPEVAKSGIASFPTDLNKLSETLRKTIIAAEKEAQTVSLLIPSEFRRADTGGLDYSKDGIFTVVDDRIDAHRASRGYTFPPLD